MTLIATDRETLKTVLAEILAESREIAERANPEKLYTIAQTARMLHKSYNTVRRMVDQKRLTATGDGKYISQRAINDYLAGK
jgi:phage terminase large subunit-like protein